jgi:hypothetical protein
MFFLAMSPIWHTVPLAKPRAHWVVAKHSHFTSLQIVSNFHSTLTVNCSSTGVALEGFGFMFLTHSQKENQILSNKVKRTHHMWSPRTNGSTVTEGVYSECTVYGWVSCILSSVLACSQPKGVKMKVRQMSIKECCTLSRGCKAKWCKTKRCISRFASPSGCAV